MIAARRCGRLAEPAAGDRGVPVSAAVAAARAAGRERGDGDQGGEDSAKMLEGHGEQLCEAHAAHRSPRPVDPIAAAALIDRATIVGGCRDRRFGRDGACRA